MRPIQPSRDRKSTRLNSSHTVRSYAVFCLKKKNSAISPSGSECSPRIRAWKARTMWNQRPCWRCSMRFARPDMRSFLFVFNDTATTEIYTLSLHDALPILIACASLSVSTDIRCSYQPMASASDRKSTRLNSSHTVISYAVFCLQKTNNLPRPQHVHITKSKEHRTQQ